MERRCIYKAARSARSLNSSKYERDLKGEMSQNQGHSKKLTLALLPASNWSVGESWNAFPGVTSSPGSRLLFEAAASSGVGERGSEREREGRGGRKR